MADTLKQELSVLLAPQRGLLLCALISAALLGGALLFEHVGPDVSIFPSSSLSACFRLVEADLGIAALPRGNEAI